MLLRCENVTVTHRDVCYLEKVKLSISSPEVVVLYGSGHAKTSLFRQLCGLQAAHPKALISWQGVSLARIKKPYQRRNELMSLFFSRFYFVRGLTVQENVLLPGRLLNSNQKALTRRLDLLCELFAFSGPEAYLDLTRLLSVSVDELSNGQKEIVSLARALINDPELIMADELMRSFDDPTEKILMARLFDARLGIGRRRSLFLLTPKTSMVVPGASLYRIDEEQRTVVPL